MEAQKALNKAFNYQNKKRTRSKSIDSQDNLSQKQTQDPNQEKEKDESALTELNMCAILSHKGDHLAALKHVKSSIDKLENDLASLKAKIDSDLTNMELIDETKEK